jgi:hypothetical protein
MFRAFSGILGNQASQNPRLFLFASVGPDRVAGVGLGPAARAASVTLGRPFHRSDSQPLRRHLVGESSVDRATANLPWWNNARFRSTSGHCSRRSTLPESPLPVVRMRFSGTT